MFENALVLLDLSDNDDTLLAALEGNAERLGVKRVVVVHVLNEDAVAPELADVLTGDQFTEPPELSLAVERLGDALPDVEVRSAYRQGTPELQLSMLCKEYDVDLILLGRPAATIEKAGWGSSGSKLVRLAPCSCLVLPRGSSLDLSGPAVVGLDYSQHALLGLRVACRVAGGVHAVYHFHAPRSHKAGLNSKELADKVQAKARKLLDEQVEPLGLRCGPELEIIGEGKVGEALIERAGDGLLVVGSRGITTMAWVLLGSNANRVAGRSRGPVLIVRDKAQEPKGVLERLVGR